MPRPIPVFHASLVTLTLLASAAPAAAGALAPPAVRLALENHRDGGWTVAARLDGRPVTLLLDTGSTRTFVRRAVATALDLKPAARFEIATPLGSAAGLCARGVSLAFGALRLELDCLGWRADGDDAALPEGVDGLLGWDAFAGRALLLDPDAGELWLGGLGLGRWVDGVAVPAGWAEGRLWIELAPDGRRPDDGLRLVIDSGADTTLLFGDAARRLSARAVPLATARRLATLGGDAARPAVLLPKLRAAGRAVGAGPALLLPEVGDRIEDGLVPLARVGALFVDLDGGVRLDAHWRSAPLPAASGDAAGALAAR